MSSHYRCRCQVLNLTSEKRCRISAFIATHPGLYVSGVELNFGRGILWSLAGRTSKLMLLPYPYLCFALESFTIKPIHNIYNNTFNRGSIPSTHLFENIGIGKNAMRSSSKKVTSCKYCGSNEPAGHDDMNGFKSSVFRDSALFLRMRYGNDKRFRWMIDRQTDRDGVCSVFVYTLPGLKKLVHLNRAHYALGIYVHKDWFIWPVFTSWNECECLIWYQKRRLPDLQIRYQYTRYAVKIETRK